jgi:hypothetical protein
VALPAPSATDDPTFAVASPTDGDGGADVLAEVLAMLDALTPTQHQIPPDEIGSSPAAAFRTSTSAKTGATRSAKAWRAAPRSDRYDGHHVGSRRRISLINLGPPPQALYVHSRRIMLRST